MKNSTKERNKIVKKINILNEVFDGSILCGSLLAAFAAVTLTIGAVAGVTSNLSMQEKADAIYESNEYQVIASEGIARLDEKLANGEISQEEYNEGIDAIYSIPAVVEYAEKADDAELRTFVESYKSSQDVADAALGTGLPIFGGSAAAVLGCAALAGKSMKKKKNELAESQVYDVQRSFE